MKKSKVATFVAAIVLISACLTASQANARDNIVVQVKFQGKGAAAFWWIPTDACRTTFVNVFADDNLRREATSKVMTSGAGAYISRYNYCANQTEIDAYGDVALSPNQFTAKDSLTLASLIALIPIHDYVSGADFFLSVDLSWKSGDTIYGGTST